jgi:hypothetical protein
MPLAGPHLLQLVEATFPSQVTRGLRVAVQGAHEAI